MYVSVSHWALFFIVSKYLHKKYLFCCCSVAVLDWHSNTGQLRVLSVDFPFSIVVASVIFLPSVLWNRWGNLYALSGGSHLSCLWNASYFSSQWLTSLMGKKNCEFFIFLFFFLLNIIASDIFSVLFILNKYRNY